jgi:uncharacterized membrane protein YbhN (UPF0104 family)
MAKPDPQNPTSRRLVFLKTGLTVAFIAAGIWFIEGRLAEFKTVALPTMTAVLAVIVGVIASIFFRSLYNYVTGRHLGAQLSLPESFMLSAVVTAGNVILPASPGATMRAVYMKRVHAFPYSYFASSMALYVVITTLLMSLLCVVLLLLIQSKLNYFRPDLLLALPIIALIALLSLAWRQGATTTEQSGDTSWSLLRNSYLDLVKTRKLVLASVLIVISNVVVASVIWFIVLGDYDSNISSLEASLFAASQVASGLINLTPGAAGFQEIVGVYVGQSFAMTTVQLFAVLIWVRLVRVLTSVALGIPCAVALHLRSQ